MDFKVSIVLATRDRAVWLSKCIESLKVQKHVLETLVIDDTGKEAIGCEQVRQKGVALTNDAATHVYFTDDDAVVDVDCLKILCDPQIWQKGKVGAVGGSAVRMNSPLFHTKSYHYLTDPMTIDHNGVFRDLSGYYTKNPKWYPADHLIGCNMLVLKSAFNEVGGMSPEFDSGTIRGETDLCLKLREKGYLLYFNGVARVFHYKQNWQTTETHKRSDKFFREKWKSKQFLGHIRPKLIQEVIIVGKR